jgi:hypothetical protein
MSAGESHLARNRRFPLCPNCHAKLDDVKVVRYDGPFRCPACDTQIYVPRTYLLVIFWISAVITVIICLSLPLTGVGFIFGMLVVLFPTMFSVALVVRNLYPPKLAVHRDPNSILSD